MLEKSRCSLCFPLKGPEFLGTVGKAGAEEPELHVHRAGTNIRETSLSGKKSLTFSKEMLKSNIYYQEIIHK